MNNNNRDVLLKIAEAIKESPLTSEIEAKVDKSAIENAGISAKTYTTLFDGEFTVTTANESGYDNPVGTVSVTSPSFATNKTYRVTVNGTQYILYGRVWKDVDYENGTYATYNYVGAIVVRKAAAAHAIGDANVTFCIRALSNSLEISTTVAGTYTILVESINETFIKLPDELLYGTARPIIEVENNNNPNYSILGLNNMSSYGAVAIGDNNKITAEYGRVFGDNNAVSDRCGIAIGDYNQVGGTYAQAIGTGGVASGDYSQALGRNVTASGIDSIAMGYKCTASGDFAVAIGNQATASDDNAFASGQKCTASGANSFAYGYNSQASGWGAVSIGLQNVASGQLSSAFGYQTIANHAEQYVFGTNNIEDPSTADATSKGNYVEIVGNGTSENARSNARTLDWSGNEELAGNITIGKGSANEFTIKGENVKAWDVNFTISNNTVSFDRTVGDVLAAIDSGKNIRVWADRPGRYITPPTTDNILKYSFDLDSIQTYNDETVAVSFKRVSNTTISNVAYAVISSITFIAGQTVSWNDTFIKSA